jgi:hypothetical protein
MKISIAWTVEGDSVMVPAKTTVAAAKAYLTPCRNLMRDGWLIREKPAGGVALSNWTRLPRNFMLN